MEKLLGKIDSVYVGIGGYNDAMIGIYFTFSSGSTGVGSGQYTWDPSIITCNENSKWTEDERNADLAEIMRFISKLLNEAKVGSVDKLKGKPVELIFEGNTLKDWRILTEVL